LESASIIEGIHHPLHTAPQFFLDLKIPEPQYNPAFGLVIIVDFPVLLPVSFDFQKSRLGLMLDTNHMSIFFNKMDIWLKYVQQMYLIKLICSDILVQIKDGREVYYINRDLVKILEG